MAEYSCRACIINDMGGDCRENDEKCKLFWRRLSGMLNAGPPDGMDIDNYITRIQTALLALNSPRPQ